MKPIFILHRLKFYFSLRLLVLDIRFINFISNRINKISRENINRIISTYFEIFKSGYHDLTCHNLIILEIKNIEIVMQKSIINIITALVSMSFLNNSFIIKFIN